MKKYILILVVFTMGIANIPDLMSQEELRGTVYFQKIDKFDYEPTGRLELDQYAKTLPSEFKFEKVLHFDTQRSLFEKSENPAITELSRRDRWILRRSQFGKNPKPEAEKIYCDFENEEKTEVLEFMTRAFLVESKIDKHAWKFLNTPKKIQDYICMAAETTIDSQVVKVWFTPQIPVPAGPEIYNGLPGMILAVEKNDETIYMATSIELNPAEDKLIKPKEGKKITKEKLDKLIEEKIKEFKGTGGGRGLHGKGRH